MEQMEWEYIIAIAEEKSISRAAKRLYISQPALSKYLREREQKIGGALFVRARGEVIPTPLGKVYLKYAAEMKRLSEECSREMQKVIDSDLRKTILIGIPASRVTMCTSLLVQLESMNPGCTFRIVTDHSAEILRKAEAHEVDLAVINSTSRGILLIREVCGLYLSPKIEQRLSLAKGQPVTIRMLQEEQFILSNTENIAGIIANRAFRREKIQPRKVTVVDNTQLALDMASAMGCAAFIMKNYREDDHFHPLEPALYNDLRLWKISPLEGIRLKGIRF